MEQVASTTGITPDPSRVILRSGTAAPLGGDGDRSSRGVGGAAFLVVLHDPPMIRAQSLWSSYGASPQQLGMP